MKLIEQFAETVIQSGTYDPMDRFYVINKIRALVGDQDASVQDGAQVKDQLIDLAVTNGKIEGTITDREILNDQLMDLVTPTPAQMNREFWQRYEAAPEDATTYFYDFCKQNDYIKVAAIKKNVEFSRATQYGDLEITINLSKPEKDPKAIAAAAQQTSAQYPQCQLCMENEGYLGRLGYPARSNHRIIRMEVGGQEWGFQYSPYAYFNEHCIFLDAKHEPMQINAQTIKNLIQIEQTFPAYFVGSNADLPIVGGSMLAHEHYQGGRHIFPMMKATIKTPLTFTGFEHVTAGVVNWPMTDIRLVSADTDQLVALSDKIMTAWKQYSDPSVSVVATTGDTSHHTVTPIMHREKETYVLDLVLRDNNTSAQYPNGIFHPHDEVAHIKKENIGLIEVMGRAILPARLKTEMQEVKKYWLGDANEIAAYHQPWANQIKTQQAITATNVDDVMEQALADVFAQVLENAGVFKNDDKGQEALAKFVQTI